MDVSVSSVEASVSSTFEAILQYVLGESGCVCVLSDGMMSTRNFGDREQLHHGHAVLRAVLSTVFASRCLTGADSSPDVVILGLGTHVFDLTVSARMSTSTAPAVFPGSRKPVEVPPPVGASVHVMTIPGPLLHAFVRAHAFPIGWMEGSGDIANSSAYGPLTWPGTTVFAAVQGTNVYHRRLCVVFPRAR